MLAPCRNSGHVLGRTGEAGHTNQKTARIMDGVCFCVGTAEPHQVDTLGVIQNGQHDHEPTTNQCPQSVQETVTAATQPAETRDNPTTTIDRQGNITCYKCHGPNHFAKECQYQRKEMQRRSVQMSCRDI